MVGADQAGHAQVHGVAGARAAHAGHPRLDRGALVEAHLQAVERARGVTASSLKAEKRQGLRVHGRKGEACPVCGDTVRQVIYADSTFEYCATCQTGGKPLADRVLSRLGVRR